MCPTPSQGTLACILPLPPGMQHPKRPPMRPFFIEIYNSSAMVQKLKGPSPSALQGCPLPIVSSHAHPSVQTRSFYTDAVPPKDRYTFARIYARIPFGGRNPAPYPSACARGPYLWLEAPVKNIATGPCFDPLWQWQCCPSAVRCNSGTNKHSHSSSK